MPSSDVISSNNPSTAERGKAFKGTRGEKENIVKLDKTSPTQTRKKAPHSLYHFPPGNYCQAFFLNF
jgi:hypothetical protein